jgi:hypothetical protein
VAFPVPDPSTSESADARRDERKRQASPPSYFYAQSQAILTAVRYFDPLHSGYAGTANKHKNRMWGALLVQLLAAFEFTMKDFVAQTLDATHIYDEEVRSWDWLQIDVPAVMSTRGELTRLGAILIHPLQGWQVPETLNARYMDIFRRQPVANDELESLRDLWVVRHSVAHNGGLVTHPDARRLRSPALAERQVLIDLDYLASATGFLRTIVQRLSGPIRESLMRRWFREGATQTWEGDEADYRRIKWLTSYVQSRPSELPAVTEPMYDADLAAYTA